MCACVSLHAHLIDEILAAKCITVEIVKSAVNFALLQEYLSALCACIPRLALNAGLCTFCLKINALECGKFQYFRKLSNFFVLMHQTEFLKNMI